jgi:hypothetical protein
VPDILSIRPAKDADAEHERPGRRGCAAVADRPPRSHYANFIPVEGHSMIRRTLLALAAATALSAVFSAGEAQAQEAFGRQWSSSYSTQDWNRFYHYPYVFYPQNYWSADYYRSAESLYFRYPPEMRVPVYNNKWQNYYPQERRYHWGSHFMTDVF